MRGLIQQVHGIFEVMDSTSLADEFTIVLGHFEHLLGFGLLRMLLGYSLVGLLGSAQLGLGLTEGFVEDFQPLSQDAFHSRTVAIQAGLLRGSIRSHVRGMRRTFEAGGLVTGEAINVGLMHQTGLGLDTFSASSGIHILMGAVAR